MLTGYRLLPNLARQNFDLAAEPTPMTLGNMRELGVQNLVAYCLNDACRHTALIDVSSYPAETEVPSFANERSAARAGQSTKGGC